MKINIELNMPDNRTFLNFWNWKDANDVICEIIDGKLMLAQYDLNSDELPPKEITIIEFIGMVKDRIKIP